VKRGFIFCGASREISKRNISSASEKAFPEFFVAELPQKRVCFNTQEFTRFL
jgi:hypothetical protein